MTHEAILEVLGGAVAGEQRDLFAADLAQYSPEELADELRITAQLVEGFAVASEGIGAVTLLALSDCRERVRNARTIAEQAARV
jgi:hypothetical protein